MTNTINGRIRRAALTSAVFAMAVAAASASANSGPAGAAASVSQAPFFTFPTADGVAPSELDGASTLVRTKSGIGYVADTRGLLSSGAYTNWFVVFNRPEQCLDKCACGLADLTNPFAEVGVFYATGRVADVDGQATFTAETDLGELPSGPEQIPFPALAAGAGPRAEIHLVVREHKRASRDPKIREAQLSTFNGGCGPKGCVDVQVSVHRSPSCKVRRGGE